MTFWKKARGDHILTAAIVTSIGLNTVFAETIFRCASGIIVPIWFIGASLLGFFLPLCYFVPSEWIDQSDTIPVHSFWKELLS